MNLDQIQIVLVEMRERKINHGKAESPTLHAWADRIERALQGHDVFGLEHDIDLMRDVYMTATQRAAYDRIVLRSKAVRQ